LFGTAVSEDELEFSFDWDYIRGRGGSYRVSKLVSYKNLKIKSYLAPFWVRGNPELIALGWECGFGSANSQGFGMAGL
jgi:CRISPR-associated endoribonuclease Cas6